MPAHFPFPQSTYPNPPLVISAHHRLTNGRPDLHDESTRTANGHQDGVGVDPASMVSKSTMSKRLAWIRVYLIELEPDPVPAGSSDSGRLTKMARPASRVRKRRCRLAVGWPVPHLICRLLVLACALPPSSVSSSLPLEIFAFFAILQRVLHQVHPVLCTHPLKLSTCE